MSKEVAEAIVLAAQMLGNDRFPHGEMGALAEHSRSQQHSAKQLAEALTYIAEALHRSLESVANSIDSISVSLDSIATAIEDRGIE